MATKLLSKEFSLRWNDFCNNLTSGFLSHLNENNLVDVTIAVEGQLLAAHKLVLSVCSPYFKNIFKENPCQHPVIILKDVKHTEVISLLKFMYQGEVNIKQDDLSTFLKVAQMLQIKGLEDESVHSRRITNRNNKTRKKQVVEDNYNSIKKLKNESNVDGDKDDVYVEPVVYRLSARGRPQLVHEGYVYNMTSRSKVYNSSHYRCAEQHRGCRGKCSVIAERFMPTGVHEHNHPPSYQSEYNYRKKKGLDTDIRERLVQ
ncbi:Protein tramtrack, beta isoform [Trachymyrmex septentrionalis]|uniref:Protein tramtrack, beta isoform n=1 Tax=Trachymyrmex septentrionalis TaxID=34720 RepID=A0A195F1L9_9HYME|nr:Protein tramtrack, beta isoform [Trachymyrmex septentrionalis]